MHKRTLVETPVFFYTGVNMAKGASPKHTACKRGTLVLIKTKGGEVFTDVFIERKGGDIFLKGHGKLNKRDMRSFQVAPRKVIR